jgi:carboxypeptidase Q
MLCGADALARRILKPHLEKSQRQTLVCFRAIFDAGCYRYRREIWMLRTAQPILSAILFISTVAAAQHPVAPVELPPEIRRTQQALQSAARSSNYAYDQIRHLCDNIGPRLSGSPQAAGAVEYVAQQMRELGLEVKLEPVTVRHWVRGREEAHLVRYPGQVPGTQQKIVVTSLGDAIATPDDGITAPVVVVDNFDELDRLADSDVKGKIVLFNYAFDEELAMAGRAGEAYDYAVQYRYSGASRAAKKGAVASLVRSVGAPGFRLVHTGALKYDDNATKIPAGAITTEDADVIAYLTKQGEVSMHLVLTPRDLPPAQSYNVVADLKGSEHPEQVILVSGHLDSWDLGTGAIDDASGVGVAMDVLRVIRSVDPMPKRTIRFVAWMNEENGSAGGKAYAEQHKAELDNHVAGVEIDDGDGRPLGFQIHSSTQRAGPLMLALHAISDPIGGVINVDDAPGADLTYIDKGGVPAITPRQDNRHYFDYHHTTADTFDKVRLGELRLNVEAISQLVYAFAQQ